MEYIGVKKRNKFKKNKFIFICAMLALPLLQWIVFWLMVNLESIKLAFLDARTDTFSYQNFIYVWDSLTNTTGAETINIALKNTLKYFGSSLLIINPISLLIAYFIYKQIFGYKVFRIIFYLPMIVSSVVMVSVFREVINPGGFVDALLKLFNSSVPEKGWLADPSTATTTILFFTIWTGFASNMLLFLGALTRVPDEILEAAKLDGCPPFVELVRIILPLILPSMVTVTIVTCTNIFNSSGPILLFTSGDYKTTTISYWIFEMIYDGTGGGSVENYNFVSCAGLCFTLVGIPFILAIRYLMDKIPAVEY